MDPIPFRKTNTCDICLRLTPKSQFKYETIQLAIIGTKVLNMLVKKCESCAKRDSASSIHLINKVNRKLDKFRESGDEVKIIYHPFVCLNSDRYC